MQHIVFSLENFLYSSVVENFGSEWLVYNLVVRSLDRSSLRIMTATLQIPASCLPF